VGALVGRPGGPGPLRPGGGLGRAVDVLGTPARYLLDHLAGGRVPHLVRLAGRGADALAFDDHGRQLGTPFRSIGCVVCSEVHYFAMAIRLEREGAVGVIVLDRPPANSYDYGFLRELSSAVDDARADDGVRAVVVASASERFFSAGADV